MMSEQSGRITALGLLVTLSVTMLLSGVLLSYSAEAADLTAVSDTLTVSAPASASNHTITFTIANQIPSGGSLSLDFQGTSAVFATGSVDYTDIDVLAPGQATLTSCGAQTTSDWGVCISGSKITFQAGSTALFNPGPITVRIGTHATSGATGDQQLTNPAGTGATEITIRTFNASNAELESGVTFVAIVNGVTLNAVVAPSFTFVIDALLTGEAVDDYVITSSSEDSYVGFGTLTAGTDYTMGSSLSVQSNATNGFVVTVQQNHNMLASSGADIDAFKDGVVQYPAATWTSPVGTIGNELTYGHMGVATEDSSTISATASVGAGGSDGMFIGLVAGTPRTIWSYGGAADGVTQDIGHIDVGYRVAITALQEAGRYQSRLMYIATPTF